MFFKFQKFENKNKKYFHESKARDLSFLISFTLGQWPNGFGYVLLVFGESCRFTMSGAYGSIKVTAENILILVRKNSDIVLKVKQESIRKEGEGKCS